MSEVGGEVGDGIDLLLKVLLVLSRGANSHAEFVLATEAIARVDASWSVVLVLAHKFHVVCLFVQPGEVKHVAFEGAFDVHGSPVGTALVDVEAQVLTVAHSIDELFADKIGYVRVRLSAQGHLENLGGDRG